MADPSDLERPARPKKKFNFAAAQEAREALVEAMQDEYRGQAQMDALNTELAAAVRHLPQIVDKFLEDLFLYMRDDPEDQSYAINNALASGELEAKLVYDFDINPDHMDEVTVADIMENKNYIALHRFAQKADIAINLQGLAAGESCAPHMSIDMTRTYEDGAAESRYGYPAFEPAPEPEATQEAAKPQREKKPGIKYEM